MSSVLWLIQGEASNHSGGGEREVFAITSETHILPDVDNALKNAFGEDENWYLINSIVLLVDGFTYEWLRADRRKFDNIPPTSKSIRDRLRQISSAQGLAS